MVFSKEAYLESIADHPEFEKMVFPENIDLVTNFMTVPVELSTDSFGSPKIFVARSDRFEDLYLVEEFIWQNKGNENFAYFMTIERENQFGKFYVLRASY